MGNRIAKSFQAAGVVLVAHLLVVAASADTTIDSTDKYAHVANAGWVDFAGDITDGVVVAENVLSGYAFAANFGWIHFGDGSPADGIAYANDSATDYGVNHDNGELTGQAYSANTGWITFEQTFGKPGIDLSTGAFTGFAYSANLGWLNLATGLATDTMICPDSDGDGIADYWEHTHFGDLVTADAVSDSDDDGYTDLAEYGANTDPLDGTAFLSFGVTDFEKTVASTEVNYEVTAGPGRVLIVEESLNLEDWDPVQTYAPLTSVGTFDDIYTYLTSARRFFRVTPQKPLQE